MEIKNSPTIVSTYEDETGYEVVYGKPLYTLQEMKEKLVEQVDEITLIDWLEVNSEDIVNAFEDKVVANYDKLLGELE